MTSCKISGCNAPSVATLRFAKLDAKIAPPIGFFNNQPLPETEYDEVPVCAFHFDLANNPSVVDVSTAGACK